MNRQSFRKRLQKFLIASSATFSLNVGLTFLFVDVCGLMEPAGFALTLTIVFFVNFASLRYYVYGENKISGQLKAQLRQCLIVAISFRIAEWVLFTVAVEGFAANYIVTVVLVQIISAIFKFAVYDQWIFKPKTRPLESLSEKTG